MLQSAAAWLFVLIWSSGFVVARGISGEIDPYLFLLVRFFCVTAIFAIAMLLLRAPLPTRSEIWRLMATGALMQGMYLGPSFWAVSQGLEAGIMSLMGSLQPPITALFAWYLFQEEIKKTTIAGLLIGLFGVTVAVAPALFVDSNAIQSGVTQSAVPFIWVVLAASLSIGAITAGTLLQKSSILSVPLLSSITFQSMGSIVVMIIMAAVFAEPVLPINALSISYLAWAVLILSIGGFTLLTWLVRQGSATRASSLLFIVPPLTAFLSWLLYDESLGYWQISGFIIALIGVMLARKQA